MKKMKKMKRMKNLIQFILTSMIFISYSTFASQENERAYLMQLLNQLNAMKPLIIAAHREQLKDERIKFHYVSFKDQYGKKHNGLLDDVNAIEKGIQEKLENTPVSPHAFVAINGDYIEHDKKA